MHVLLQPPSPPSALPSNPPPPPHVSLMYINPDSRGQCVLGGGQTPLPQSITFNLHSSACGCRSGREMCLAFPKMGCFLGVNQRDTPRGRRAAFNYSVFFLTRFPSSCAHLYQFGRRKVCLFVMLLHHGLQYLPCQKFEEEKKGKKKTFLTDWLTNRPRHSVVTDGPAPSSEMPSALTVKQRAPVCHFAVWGGWRGRRSPTWPA